MANANKLSSDILSGETQADAQNVDVLQLMQDIKQQARRALMRDLAEGEKTSTAHLLKLEELNYLNKNYQYPDTTLSTESVSSHWPILGPIVAGVRKLFYKTIRNKLLFNYFTQERDFQSNLVRCLNELARSIDDKKLRLEEDHVQSLLAVEEELRQLVDINNQKSHQRFESQYFKQEQLSTRIETLENVISGIEKIISRLGKRESLIESGKKSVSIPDYQYLLLENRFRGSEEDIHNRVSVYTDELRQAPGVVCEIGSGRGELQSVLRDAGVDSFGLELDDAMVEHCLELGLNVCKADGIVHLSQLRDNSLGAIVALQVIEHLPVAVLKSFFELAAVKLKNNGLIIVETINIASLQALRANYFRDPTHTQPLHPETTSYMMQQAGLEVKEIRYLSPFPKSVEFEEIEMSAEYPPRFREAVEKMNRNTQRLNDIFFGSQDYAVIATVKKA